MQVPRLVCETQLRRRHVLKHWRITLHDNHIERDDEQVALRVSLLQVCNFDSPILLLDCKNLHHLCISKHLHRLPILIAIPVDFCAAEVRDEAILRQRRDEREEVVLLHDEVVDDLLQQLRVVIVFDRLPDDIDRRIVCAKHLNQVWQNPVNRRLDIFRHPVIEL